MHDPEGHFVLRLLGPAAIEHNGVEVVEAGSRRERVRALFAIVARRITISREELADRLWPDLDAEAAANNLRVNLSHLVRALSRPAAR